MDQKGTLLIGGNGFIGQALVPEIKKRHKPIYILARNIEHLVEEAGVSLHAGSLDDVQLLNDLIPLCDEIVYLASNTTPGTSQRVPLFEFDTNLRPLLKFVQCLQDYSSIHLVYISSGGAIYGDQNHLPVTEDAQINPKSYHASGKAAAEAVLAAYSQIAENRVTVLRPSNIYGPGQSGSAQFGLIPKLLKHAYHNETVDIWGDGENTRDYLYIDDFVAACNNVLEHKTASSIFNIYNVGSGVGYTINQVFHFVEQATLARCKRQYTDSRKIDVKKIVLDIQHIKNELKWMPKTDLETGIKLTWDWFLQQQRNG